MTRPTSAWHPPLRDRRLCVRGPLAMVAALIAASGCAPRPWDVQDFLQSHEYYASGSDIKVMPGDYVSLASPHALELDGLTEEVGVDGKIDLDLLGEVHVAGLSARQIKRKLEDQLAPYYEDSRLRVRISGHQSQKIYVFGQVGGAGAREYTGRDTVFDVLMESRPTFLAWKSEIRVIRASPDPNERREIKVDFDKMAKRGDMRLNMLLQPGDIVYVPPTPLAWVGLRIQEILFPVAPVFQAYSMPAQVMSATDEYEGDDDDDSGSGGRRGRSSFRRR